MIPVLMGHYEPGSTTWHKVRAQGIGGSEIASVVGLSPWESAFTLWHRKRGSVGPAVETESMYWGKRQEPIILDEWRQRHDDDYYVTSTSDRLYRHPDRPWQLASPDGLVFHWATPSDHVGRLLEAKTADAHSSHEWGDDGTADVPPYYRAQVMWYLDVFGLPYADLAVLIGGNTYREYTIPYDADEAARLRSAGREFWRSIVENVPPPLDGSDSTYRTVRELHPDIDADMTIQVDPMLIDDLDELLASKRTLYADIQEYKARLSQQMGNARYAEAHGLIVARRQSMGNGTPYVVPIPVEQRRLADADMVI